MALGDGNGHLATLGDSRSDHFHGFLSIKYMVIGTLTCVKEEVEHVAPGR